MKLLKVIGIDPGSKKCGFAILDFYQQKIRLIDADIIHIDSTDLQIGMKELALKLDGIFDRYNIEKASIEDIFYAKNPQSVLKLAQFRGFIIAKLLDYLTEFYSFTPLQIKKTLTGNGKADKTQVAFMVQKLLNLKQPIKQLDISDAMAVALTYIFHHKNSK